MAKKHLYFAEAERLYVVEQCTLAEIASRLQLAERTIRTWKDEGDWERKREQHLASRQAFHEELYTFARKLMTTVSRDLDSGEKVDAGRLYTLTRLIPLLTKVKDYEDVVKRNEPSQKPAGLTEDVLRVIEREVLGLER